MTHYADGTRFERKVRVHLAGNGYEVIRAAGSKGGTKADLVALKPGQLLLIQCKRAGILPPGEWDRLVQVAGWVGALPLLAANGPLGRGVTYTRLCGPKLRGRRTQPVEPFVIDEIAKG